MALSPHLREGRFVSKGNESGEWRIMHCSIPRIDHLISFLQCTGSGECFYDVFFGETLTQDPSDECWLKTRVQWPTGAAGPQEVLLSFKMTQQQEAQAPGSFQYTLVDDEAIARVEVEARLQETFDELQPFLTLLVHRFYLKEGENVFWVDASALASTAETRCLGDVLTNNTATILNPPTTTSLTTGCHRWFVSIGCRYQHPETLSLAQLARLFRIPTAIIPTYTPPADVYWVPSKAYQFLGLADEQAERLQQDYQQSLLMRIFNPFDTASHLILPLPLPSSPGELTLDAAAPTHAAAATPIIHATPFTLALADGIALPDPSSISTLDRRVCATTITDWLAAWAALCPSLNLEHLLNSLERVCRTNSIDLAISPSATATQATIAALYILSLDDCLAASPGYRSANIPTEGLLYVLLHFWQSYHTLTASEIEMILTQLCAAATTTTSDAALQQAVVNIVKHLQQYELSMVITLIRERARAIPPLEKALQQVVDCLSEYWFRHSLVHTKFMTVLYSQNTIALVPVLRYESRQRSAL